MQRFNVPLVLITGKGHGDFDLKKVQESKATEVDKEGRMPVDIPVHYKNR